MTKTSSFLKQSKALLNSCGFDLVRYQRNYLHNSYVESYSRRIVGSNRWITCLVDVGAHVGLYAQKMRESGFAGAIHCFEPQIELHQQILQRSASDSSWIAYNYGVGDTNALLDFNVAVKNDTASSFLPISDPLLTQRLGIVSRKAEIVRLDDFLLPKLAANDALWVKIDAEGFEDRVINGGRELLDRALFVEVELSFAKRFSSGGLAHDIISLLGQSGLILYTLDNNYYLDGHRLNYCDAIFVRGDFAPPELNV
jgi:FkbM family methyltransferase